MAEKKYSMNVLLIFLKCFPMLILLPNLLVSTSISHPLWSCSMGCDLCGINIYQLLVAHVSSSGQIRIGRVNRLVNHISSNGFLSNLET